MPLDLIDTEKKKKNCFTALTPRKASLYLSDLLRAKYIDTEVSLSSKKVSI